MDLTTVYSKTAKGVQAITQKGKRLPSKLLRALSLVDGRATVEEILEKARELPTSELPQALADLARDGYLKTVARAPLTQFSVTPDTSASMVVSETVDETFFKVLAETETRKRRMKEAAENLQEVRQNDRAEAAAAAESEAARRKTEAREAAEGEERSRQEAVRQKIAQVMAQEEAAIKARRQADILAHQEKVEKLEREVAEAEERARREAQEKAAKEAVSRAAAELRAKEDEKERTRQEAEQRKIAEAKAQEETERKAREEAEAGKKREAAEKAWAEEETRAREEAERKAREVAEQNARQEMERQKAAVAQALEEAQRKAQEEADNQARREKAELEQAATEERMRREAEEKAATEAAERKAQEEAAAIARAEASRQLEMEARAREEAERNQARERKIAEAEAKAKAEAEELARAEARRQLRLEARAREEAERNQAREEAEAKAMAEAEERKRLEAEAEHRARLEAEEKARAEEEARIQAEADAKAREEAERKAREEAEAQAKREAEVQAILEAEKQARDEEAARAKAEADARTREEAERKAREEAEARAIVEAEKQARREAEGKIRAQEEALAKARAQEERRTREEAEQEKRERAEIEARARALADARAAEAEKDQQKAQAKAKKPRHPVKWGKAALISLAALIVLPIVLLQVMSLNLFIPTIEKLASERMREPVAIHSLRASLWPVPHLLLEGVAIGKLRDIKMPAVRITPELAAFFGSTKTIKAIEVESLKIDQDALTRVMAWVAPGGGAEETQIRRIFLKTATIDIKGMSLPPFEADIALAATSKFERANIRSADKKIELFITPKTDGVEVDVAAHDWQPPLGPNLTFSELRAKAMATPEGMRISEIDGRLFGGKANGSATIQWGGLWRAEGDFVIENILLAEAMPALTGGIALTGKLDAKSVYSMQSKDLPSLFDNPRVKASFNIRDGAINNIDLARAIQPRAAETTGGKTLFAGLSGSMMLEGSRYQYRQMKLAAGLLSASGEADIMPDKQLTGKASVEMKLPSTTVHARLTLSGDPKQPVLRR